MSFRKGLARAGRTLDSPQKKSLNGVVSTLTLDNPAGWLSGEESVAMSRDKAMKVSTVNRCVEVLSTSMSVLPVYLMNETTKERLNAHPLRSMLWGRANDAMSTFDYQRLMMCNQLLRGNAYAAIVRNPSSGRPKELLPLPPDYVQMVFDNDGKLWYVFTHPITGEMTLLRPEDVIHYKAYSEDGIEGVSVLKRASLTLSTARAAAQYENSTWMNGGQPSGILTTDADLGKEIPRKAPDGSIVYVDAKEELRRSWENVHKGPDKAFRVAVLDLGLKYQPISMTNTDAQFVESNEIRVADVCRFFGVPLHLVYAGKQSYASNEQNGIEFVNYTLLGYETQWGQEDTYKLLLPSERDASLRIKRELKVFLKGDTTAQAAYYRALREIGVLNADEIRALEDRGQIPGGSEYYASWNYGPLADFARLSVIRALGKEPDDGGTT